jgi:hypothetical protein
MDFSEFFFTNEEDVVIYAYCQGAIRGWNSALYFGLLDETQICGLCFNEYVYSAANTTLHKECST